MVTKAETTFMTNLLWSPSIFVGDGTDVVPLLVIVADDVGVELFHCVERLGIDRVLGALPELTDRIIPLDNLGSFVHDQPPDQN